MHLKPYLIDLMICLFALSNSKIALETGSSLEVGEIDITKLVSTAVCFITGFTTLYRFVKEVRNDKKQKQKQDAENKAEKENY